MQEGEVVFWGDLLIMSYGAPYLTFMRSEDPTFIISLTLVDRARNGLFTAMCT